MSDRSRRTFLRDGATAMLTAGVLAACRGKAAEAIAATTTPSMDEMCEKGVKAFPAKTAGKGNQPFAPRIENGVKIFDMSASKIQWEVTPGQFVEAFAYNGMVPGPQIRVREGDRVRINLKNELDQSTSIHFHGLSVPNDQDGVPFITQPPIKPGQSFTYEFTVPHTGSHMYHAHHNATTQVMKGLLGAFIVESNSEPKVDLDYVMILNDGLGGFTLNGKGFPATEPLVAKRGQTIRIRYMNEGMMIHPMHLHGMPMTVIAKDGWPQPSPWKCDTLNIAPGERWDEQGMYGMVTALVVKEA